MPRRTRAEGSSSSFHRWHARGFRLHRDPPEAGPGLRPRPARLRPVLAPPLAIAASLVLWVCANHGPAQADGLPPGPGLVRADTGAIAGTVRFRGKPPPPKALRVYKERAFCGSAVPDESLLVDADRGLRNVVVTLHGAGLRGTPVRPEAIALDNVGCRFAPHVQAAPVGSTVLLLNSDPILHDAHARMGPETLFNEGLPRWRRVTRTLRRPGVVKVVCELHHAWMSAYIVVAPNRFFAVTDATGGFAVRGIPPGGYEARFWHERLGEARRRVTVTPGRTRDLEVTFPDP